MGRAVECRSCRTELPSGAAYCPSCGVPVACWACGTTLPEAAVYCPGCGIPVNDDDADDLEESYDIPGWDPPTPSVHEVWTPAPVPEVVRERTSAVGLRREGPIGKLASLLLLPATLVGLYLAIRLWGADRDASLRVLGALALFVLSPFLAGLVVLPLALLIGLAIRRTSDDTRGRVGVFGRSVVDGLANIISLAALVFILVQLWETF